VAAITPQNHRSRSPQNASRFCGFPCHAMRKKKHSNGNRYHPINGAKSPLDVREFPRFVLSGIAATIGKHGSRLADTPFPVFRNCVIGWDLCGRCNIVRALKVFCVPVALWNSSVGEAARFLIVYATGCRKHLVSSVRVRRNTALAVADACRWQAAHSYTRGRAFNRHVRRRPHPAQANPWASEAPASARYTVPRTQTARQTLAAQPSIAL